MEQLKQRISEFKYGDDLSEFKLERGSDDGYEFNDTISDELRYSGKHVIAMRDDRAKYTRLRDHAKQERSRREWEFELQRALHLLVTFKERFYASKLKAIKYVDYLSGVVTIDDVYAYMNSDYTVDSALLEFEKKLENKYHASMNNHEQLEQEIEQSRRKLKKELSASVKDGIRDYIANIGGIDAFIALMPNDSDGVQALASWCYIADKLNSKKELKAVIRWPHNKE